MQRDDKNTFLKQWNRPSQRVDFTVGKFLKVNQVTERTRDELHLRPVTLAVLQMSDMTNRVKKETGLGNEKNGVWRHIGMLTI